MSTIKISDEELVDVIRYAESSGDLLFKSDEKLFLAKKKINDKMIYIEYQKHDDSYSIRKVYFHKATIKRKKE